jgi:GNAT superfamily N-acetyltransferase
MDYAVRSGTADDAAGIAAVHVASWQAAYRGLLPHGYLDTLSVADRRQRWTRILADPDPRIDTLVAIRAGRVAGFAGVGPRRREKPGYGDGELYAIYLQPDCWGHGIGFHLHRAALDRLCELGFTTATVWVLGGNQRAVRFYRRNGWRDNGVTGVHTFAYGTRLPEIQLHRRLVVERSVS